MKFLKNYQKCEKTFNYQEDIKLATTEERMNYLVSEPNNRTTVFFSENLLAIELKKKHKYS